MDQLGLAAMSVNPDVEGKMRRLQHQISEIGAPSLLETNGTSSADASENAEDTKAALKELRDQLVPAAGL